MPWTKGNLLFTISVTTLISSLNAGPEAFFETGAAYGAVSENTIRFGKLLIGAQGGVPDKEMEISGLKSAEEPDKYQSNEEERFHLAKTKLQRLGPSVYCGNDSMTLHIPGPIRMPRFLVDRGDQSPVPLSEMPASCGFSLKRARRDVSLVAPYQGCHVRLQDGSYILPLFIMGDPVQMSCPVSSPLPTVSCFLSGMSISLGARAENVKVKVDGSWQPLLLICSKCSFKCSTTVDGSLVVTAPFTGSCLEMKDTDMQLSLMYGDRKVTLSCPVTEPILAPRTIEPTVAAVQDPTYSPQMFYPFPFGRPWWYPYFPGRPGVRPVPPTTTTTALQNPSQPMFPPMPMFDPYYFNSRGFPSPQQRQLSGYPVFSPYMYSFKSPVEATTPSTTTAAQFVGYPMFYGLQSKPGYPYMPKDLVFAGSSPAQSPYRSRKRHVEMNKSGDTLKWLR